MIETNHLRCFIWPIFDWYQARNRGQANSIPSTSSECILLPGFSSTFDLVLRKTSQLFCLIGASWRSLWFQQHLQIYGIQMECCTHIQTLGWSCFLLCHPWSSSRREDSRSTYRFLTFDLNCDYGLFSCWKNWTLQVEAIANWNSCCQGLTDPIVATSCCQLLSAWFVFSVCLFLQTG